MNHFIAFLAIITFIVSSPACNSNLNPKQADLEKAVDEVRINLEKESQIAIPSINVYIQTPTNTNFVSSVGENGTPVTENTYYRFASVTKNFTATAILKQYQDNWINIDDTITQMIPGTNIPYLPTDPEWNIPYKNRITIKQLLQHRAGVYDIDNDTVPNCNGTSFTDFTLSANPNHQFSAAEFANILRINNLSYWEPGKDYHYSNTGYSILGEIISRVYSQKSGSHKTYSDFLKDKIYGGESKIKLDFLFPEQASDKQLPSPYVKGMILNQDQIEIKDLENVSHHVAEGNGIGTMRDLNTYIRTLMRGENVLSRETVDLMQNSNIPGTNNPYSLGCTYFSNIGYGHNGASNGYLNLVAYDKINDVSIVVMMPVWDLKDGMNSLSRCLKAMSEAGWAVRKKLGIPSIE
jgi:D-alanyl-D-alanine carboxypeptidase